MLLLIAVVIVLAFYAGITWLGMVAWNYVATVIWPGLPELTFWQVLIISLLLGCLGSYIRPRVVGN